MISFQNLFQKLSNFGRLEGLRRMSLKVYTNRNMLGYFILSVPALLLEVFFILSLLRIPVIALPGIFHYADLAIQIAPWFVLGLSIFSVVRFRISLLLTLLIISYFISAIVSGSASLFAAGYLLSQGEIAALVVAASFCSLIGFGFLRAAKIEKKRAISVSSGPLPHQVISLFLEFFFPALVAVGLVLTTMRVVASLRAETMIFPAPLSSIFSSFLLSPVVTIITAALVITLVKDIVEPWILYYTLKPEDAIDIMKSDATQMELRIGLLSRISSGGMLFSLFVIVILMTVLVIFFGTSSIISNIYALFGMGSPTAEPNFLIRVSNAFMQFVYYLNTIINLLWG